MCLYVGFIATTFAFVKKVVADKSRNNPEPQTINLALKILLRKSTFILIRDRLIFYNSWQFRTN